MLQVDSFVGLGWSGGRGNERGPATIVRGLPIDWAFVLWYKGTGTSFGEVRLDPWLVSFVWAMAIVLLLLV